MSLALVTGGAGFIGTHLVHALLESGRAVRVLDNLEEPPPGRTASHLDPRAVFQRGDMRDERDLGRALDGVEVVFHLAATGGFTPRMSAYFEENSLGTARLLEVIRNRRLPVRRILVASSMAVYGEGMGTCTEHGRVHPGHRDFARLAAGEFEPTCPSCGRDTASVATLESDPVEPDRPYSISKFDQERLVLGAARELDLEAVAARFFLTYGPGQSPGNPYTGVIAAFASRAARGLAPILYEDGEQSRDFVYVADVVRALLLLVEIDDPRGRVFNVGTGRPTRLAEVAGAVVEAVGGTRSPDAPGLVRIGDVRHIHADASRIAALGWRALTPLQGGVARFVDWFRTAAPAFPVPPDPVPDGRLLRSIAGVASHTRQI